MRLARIGLEDARGYLRGGIAAWSKAGLPLATLPQISVEELREQLRGGGLQVLESPARAGVGGWAHRRRVVVAAG